MLKRRSKMAFLMPLLVISCTRTASDLPSSMGRSEQDLNNPLLAVSGIYRDGWMAPAASMRLAQPAGSAALRVRALVPLTNNPDFHTILEIRIDDEPLA